MVLKRKLYQVIDVLSGYQNWLVYCERDHKENKEYAAVLESMETMNELIDEHVDELTEGDVIRCVIGIVITMLVLFICFGGLDYVVK